MSMLTSAPREFTMEALDACIRTGIAAIGADEPGMTKCVEAARILQADPINGIIVESYRFIAECMERVEKNHPELFQRGMIDPNPAALYAVNRLIDAWSTKFEQRCKELMIQFEKTYRELCASLEVKKAA